MFKKAVGSDMIIIRLSHNCKILFIKLYDELISTLFLDIAN